MQKGSARQDSPRSPGSKPNETWNESNQPCVNESFDS